MVSVADFEVVEKKLNLDSGEEVAGKKAIVRVDNGAVLGIVSQGYKIVPHRDVVGAFDGVPFIKQKRLSVCDRGSVLFAEYDVNVNGGQQSLAYDVKVGDTVSFGIRAFNSYNQRFGVGFEIIANRLKCTNGMVVPRGIARLTFKHFEHVDIRQFGEVIAERVKSIPETVGMWRRWMDVNPTAACIQGYLAKTRLGKSTQEELLKKSLDSADETGVWKVWNVMTNYVSHEMKVVKEENRMLAVREKERDLLYRFYGWQWN